MYDFIKIMNTNIKDVKIEDIYNFLSIDFKNEEGITKYSQVHYYKTPPDDEDWPTLKVFFKEFDKINNLSIGSSLFENY